MFAMGKSGSSAPFFTAKDCSDPPWYLPRVSCMNGIERSHFWWPGLNAAIQEQLKSFALCQNPQNSSPEAPSHPWEWPQHTWSWAAADYAGPTNALQFLILAGAYSMWMEVILVTCKSATTQGTILEYANSVCDSWYVVTSNGTVFTSHKFRELT